MSEGLYPQKTSSSPGLSKSDAISELYSSNSPVGIAGLAPIFNAEPEEPYGSSLRLSR